MLLCDVAIWSFFIFYYLLFWLTIHRVTSVRQNDCNAEFFAKINSIAWWYILPSFFHSCHMNLHIYILERIFHSQLLRDPQEHIANGLTVFNPLLVGAVSYALIPKVYGPFDSLSILLILLGTIFRQVE